MSTLAVDEPLLERIRADAEDAERERRLTPRTVAGLGEAGVLRALVPAELGGGEVHPSELRAVVEAIAAADGAAGWIAAVSSTAGLAAAYLPADDAAELFGPGAIPAGVFAPLGRLEPGGTAPTLSGRWPLGSGVDFSDRRRSRLHRPRRPPLRARPAERGRGDRHLGLPRPARDREPRRGRRGDRGFRRSGRST